MELVGFMASTKPLPLLLSCLRNFLDHEGGLEKQIPARQNVVLILTVKNAGVPQYLAGEIEPAKHVPDEG